MYHEAMALTVTRRTIFKIFCVVLAAIIAGGLFQYFRPLPPINAEPLSVTITPSSQATLPWPGYGQAALGSSSYGILAVSGDQSPAPIASIAKIFTAMAVLKQKPLTVGEQGPNLTIDNTDLGYYNYYSTNDGSVAKVTTGEHLSEFQALEAMLLPSANNIADSLARWAFGSTDAYLTYANQMVRELGLTQTTISSASGFTAGTTSTAADLVKAGLAALDNPVIAQIVSLEKADITEAGTVHNVNWLLNQDGVNGIKTGNTTEAGGCFLFSTVRQISGQNMTLVGSVMGAPNLNKAIADSDSVIKVVDSGFEKSVLIKKGQVLGAYKTAWGSVSDAISKDEVSALVWKGQQPVVSIKLNNITAATPRGASVGQVSVTYNSKVSESNIVLVREIKKPSITWRLFRH